MNLEVLLRDCERKAFSDLEVSMVRIAYHAAVSQYKRDHGQTSSVSEAINHMHESRSTGYLAGYKKIRQIIDEKHK